MRAFHELAREYLHERPEEELAVSNALRETVAEWILSGKVSLIESTAEQRDLLGMELQSVPSENPREESGVNFRRAWGWAAVALTELDEAEYL